MELKVVIHAEGNINNRKLRFNTAYLDPQEGKLIPVVKDGKEGYSGCNGSDIQIENPDGRLIFSASMASNSRLICNQLDSGAGCCIDYSDTGIVTEERLTRLEMDNCHSYQCEVKKKYEGAGIFAFYVRNGQTIDSKVDDIEILRTIDRDSIKNILGMEQSSTSCYAYKDHQYQIKCQYSKNVKKLWDRGHKGSPDKTKVLATALESVALVYSGDEKARLEISYDGKYTHYSFRKNNEEVAHAARKYRNMSDLDTLSIGLPGDPTITSIISQVLGVLLPKKVRRVEYMNEYFFSGDLEFAHEFMVLLGGQQGALGFGYDTSALNFALDLARYTEMLHNKLPITSDIVSHLSLPINATPYSTVRAVNNILGIAPPDHMKQFL